MKFTTTITAIDPNTGELCHWQGPHIEAISWALANQYCQSNGLGYCKVDGILVSEIDALTNETTSHNYINN